MTVSNHQSMVKHHKTIVTASTSEGDDRKIHDIKEEYKVDFSTSGRRIKGDKKQHHFGIKKRRMNRKQLHFEFNKDESIK